jgi:hypothetical protein
MVRIARSLSLLLAAATLAACGGARPAEPGAAAVAVAGPVHFLQAQIAAAPARTAAGALRLDTEGCLRLGEAAILWPADAALDISRPGVVRVFHQETGAAVRVGQTVTLAAAPSTASGRCAGPALSVSSFAPANA